MLINWTTAFIRLYMAVRKSINWPKSAMPLQLVVIEPPLTSLRDQQEQTHLRKMFSVDSCQFNSGPFTSGSYVDSSSGGGAAKSSQRSPHMIERLEQWSVWDITWTRSLHTATIPQFLLHHGRDNPHYESHCGSTRESENLTQSLKFIISENISATAQWMNKDFKHVGRILIYLFHLFWQMCPKLQLYNLVDDQHLEH